MSKVIEQIPCLICKNTKAETFVSDFDGKHQKCPRCGEFKIWGTAIAVKQKRIPSYNDVAKLSGWTRDQNRAGSVPTITNANLKTILSRSIPSFYERVERVLIEAAHGKTGLRIEFNIKEPRFMAATYSTESGDLDVLHESLKNKNWIEPLSLSIVGKAKISPDGLMQLDNLRKKHVSSSQGFVAMYFDKKLDDAYTNGFRSGILQSGYDPIRIDRHEHANRIDDEIIAQINASRFVVADFTGHRGGVYFEAGYALGKNIPVFWTCRKKDFDKLHFDIRQFNCIDWDCVEDLAKRLGLRIEAVLGPGPNR